MKFTEVEVIAVDRPLHDVVVLVLQFPEPMRSQFDYNPGQHVVVRHLEDGRFHDRPYALISSPFTDDRPAIAVKRISGGVVSEYLFASAEVGMTLQLSSSQGFFYAEIPAQTSASYFLYARDIGIAPLISILKSVLFADSLSKVCLFYENKDKEQILFRGELDVLRRDFPNRLKVYYLLSSAGLLTGLLSAPFVRGSLKHKTITEILKTHQKEINKSEHFICGPDKTIQEVRSALNESGVVPHQIHQQQFYQLGQPGHARSDFRPYQLIREGNETTMAGRSDQTILEVLKTHPDQDPPYACEQGLCGTCAARLLEGEVQMNVNKSLEMADIKKGWILTCQAHPTTDVVKLKFEEETFD